MSDTDGTPVEFLMPVGAALPVRVLDGSIDDDTVVLTIELGPDDWDMADMNMLFHLQWNDRNEGQIVEGGDVQIDMQLATSLVDEVRSVLGAGDVASAISGLDREHPLRSTNAWYALRVTEQVPLPPDLAEKGEVRSGFTTRWLDEPLPE